MAAIHRLGPFRLDSEAEILFRGVDPIPLGRRAVALLRALVERPGAPVSKEALLEAAWSGLTVEESNLTVQIAALRRVLGEAPGGERWIETLPRRGYRFVAAIEWVDAKAEHANPAVAIVNLPPMPPASQNVVNSLSFARSATGPENQPLPLSGLGSATTVRFFGPAPDMNWL